MIGIRNPRWDAKYVILQEPSSDSVWDGRVKNLIYNTVTMEWEAQTSGGGGGGGGAISADTSSVETRSKPMKSIIDEASASVTYVGEAAVGTSPSASLWRIKRLTQNSSVLTIEWADGDGNLNNNWDNRASLSYS